VCHPILICTLGTSLFRPNLENLKRQLDAGTLPEERRRLAEAFARGDWSAVARELNALWPADRVCGAEINSIASMIDKGHVKRDCGLYFLHSQTKQGRQIAEILRQYHVQRGHKPVKLVEVSDLQDEDPKRFRSKGLRHLAREVAQVVRAHSPRACAINATGGYKAQIAIAVVLGQALGVTVYYKHEFFSEVIAFPPLPVALDFELWMRASGMLLDLAGGEQVVPAARYEQEWDDRYESLVERETIDGVEHIALSAAGQVFHEAFRGRFRSVRDQVLPPPAQKKRKPVLEKSGWPGEHPEIKRFMQRVTDEVPFVVGCSTWWFSPDLPETTRFTASRDNVVGIFSHGTYCVKFNVETTAQTEGQRHAAVAALNQWLTDPEWFRSREQNSAAQTARERDEALDAWKKAEKQLAALRRENQQLRRQVEKLSAQAEQDAQQRASLSRQVAELQAHSERERARGEEARRWADQLDAELRACRAELAEARKPWWRRLLRR